MNAEIICVGTELLLGHVVNTNAAYLSKRLASAGISLYFHTVVGDNPDRLRETLRLGLLRSGIVILTGGLGPTVDDITVAAIAKTYGRPLIFSKKIFSDLKKFYKSRNLKTKEERIKLQSRAPEGAHFFKNEIGTAPGILIKEDGKVVIALPGPPHELERMFDKYVIPYLVKNGYAGNEVIKTRSIRIAGMGEPEVNNKVEDLLSMSGKETVGIYTSPGIVDLKITAKAKSERFADNAIDKLQKEIEKRLGGYIFGYDDDTLELVVGKMLKKLKLKIATAESCTGGLLASKLTDISGSSDYFHMGVVTYANWAKQHLLGVRQETLKKYGAVSKEVAAEMSTGILLLSGADIGVSITGIAGPAGGTKEKPVGLVYISVACKNSGHILPPVTKKFIFGASRQLIRTRTVLAALNMVRKIICGHF